jgi:CheY-like chemotaxis protein
VVGKHILVVDDEPAIRYTLSDVLEDAGYRVVTACDGAEALRVVSRERPDAILLDLMMPVMDGWTFLVHCEVEPACAGIPIVIMSASQNLTSAQPTAPVRAVLPKPFDLDDLITLIADLV